MTYVTTAECRRYRGQTLVELLVSSGIGLLVALVLVTLYGALSDGVGRVDGMSRAVAAGQQALEIIVAHARLAGMPRFLSLRPPQPSGANEVNKSGDPLHGFAAGSNAQPLAIFGCERGIFSHVQDNRCKAVKRDSDSVVFRYAADTVATWASKHGWPTDCLGQNVTGDAIVVRFYVNRSTADRLELYCHGNGHDATPQPLVEGIEQIRLSYWLAGADVPVRASAIPHADWHRVVAIDVCVVARGPAAARPAAYLDCDGKPVTPEDRWTRTALARRVAIRNAIEDAVQ